MEHGTSRGIVCSGTCAKPIPAINPTTHLLIRKQRKIGKIHNLSGSSSLLELGNKLRQRDLHTASYRRQERESSLVLRNTEQGNFLVAYIVVHRLHSKYMRKQMVGISPLVLQATFKRQQTP